MSGRAAISAQRPQPRNRENLDFSTLPGFHQSPNEQHNPIQPQPLDNNKGEAAHTPDHVRIGGAFDGEVHHAGNGRGSAEKPPSRVPRPVPLHEVLHANPLVRQRALQHQRCRGGSSPSQKQNSQLRAAANSRLGVYAPPS
jgi:hypothetical protein